MGQNIAEFSHLAIKTNATHIDEVRGVMDQYLPVNINVLAT